MIKNDYILSRLLDNGFLTSSPSMLSFVHLGLQIFVGWLIACIVHCRDENIPIGVLRRTHHLIAAAFQTCCCFTLVAWKKNKRL